MAAPGSQIENPYRRGISSRGNPNEQQTEDPNLLRLHTAQVEWNNLFTSRSVRNEGVGANRSIVLTEINRRSNYPWGDQLVDKDGTTTRVYALNVNGFTLDRRGGQFDEFCKVAKETQADIVCCQEHNLDTTQTQVRSILYDTLRQHWSRTRITMGTSPIPFNNMFKPGGTMITAINSITGRIIGTTNDKWGRWVSQTYRGRDNVRITIISAYQVVTNNPKAGSPCIQPKILKRVRTGRQSMFPMKLSNISRLEIGNTSAKLMEPPSLANR